MNRYSVWSFVLFVSLYASLSKAQALDINDLSLKVRETYPNTILDFHTKINLKLVKITNSKLKIEDLCTDTRLVTASVSAESVNVAIDPIILEAYSESHSLPCLYGDTQKSALGLVVRAINYELDKEWRLSDDRAFLNLSGWFIKGIFKRKLTNINSLHSRLFDAKEIKTPEDTLAINLELFLLDSDYKCKRANLYQYFSRGFASTPYLGNECKTETAILIKSQKIKERNELIQILNPKNVYQVHYLFAGKGKKIMSRWGHAMFRVVVCPEGTKMGPECINDISNNYVLGFRATIQDMKMDFKKGLDGTYPSQMSILPLMEVVNDYTTGEYRDVMSVPMVMSRLEIERFINRALETYWSYEGNYFFFTNNCTTEAMNLVRSAYVNNERIQKKVIYTPIGMYNYLAKNAITDNSVLLDEKKAIYEGYLFKAADDKFNQSLALFGFNPKDENSFNKLMAVDASKRFEIYMNVTHSKVDKDSKRQVLASAMRLEEKVIQALNVEFNQKLVEILENKDGQSEVDAKVLAQFKEMILESLKVSGHLAAITKKGYGVPLASEVEMAKLNETVSVNEFLTLHSEQLLSIIKKKFPNLINQIEISKKNKSNLLKELTLLIKR